MESNESSDAPNTPVKTEFPRCFACFDPSPARYYKYKSKKWKENDVSSKITYIFSQENVDVLTAVKSASECLPSADIGICRPCLTQLINTYDWSHAVRDSVSRLSSMTTQVKRCARTPAEEKKAAKKVRANSRRALYDIPLNVTDSDDSLLAASLDSSGVCTGLESLSVTDSMPFATSTPDKNTTSSPDNAASDQMQAPEVSDKLEQADTVLGNAGVQWNPAYQSIPDKLCSSDMTRLRDLFAQNDDRWTLARAIMSIPAMVNCIKYLLLLNINIKASSMTQTKNSPSVLRSRSKIDMDNESTLLCDILHEIHSR